MSNFKFQIFKFQNFKFQISEFQNLKFQISNFSHCSKFQISDFRFQNFKFQISIFGISEFQISNFKFRNFKFQKAKAKTFQKGKNQKCGKRLKIKKRCAKRKTSQKSKVKQCVHRSVWAPLPKKWGTPLEIKEYTQQRPEKWIFGQNPDPNSGCVVLMRFQIPFKI